MKREMRYLETGSVDPYYNLALEEYVLRHRTKGDYLLLWQNDNTIVVGQNQNTQAEINQAFVDTNHIHVVRRTTGGGAVYHDLGNINYSFITDTGDLQAFSMSRFTEPIVDALRGLGLECEASGRNDILVEGRKVSGTAQRILGGRILHHGTLLFDSNPAVIAKALQVDPTKFQGKASQSVRSRVGNIREYLKKDMTIQEFWKYLKGELMKDGMTIDTLSDAEIEQIRDLRKTKYATRQWNYGQSPKFTFCNKKRFTGGSLEVYAAVHEGTIQKITFFGDFLSRSDLTPITDRLIGCEYSREAVFLALYESELENYFGTISLEEILDTMFCSTE